MGKRRVLQAGAIAWAVVGGGVALGSLRQVEPDARVLVAVVSVLGPLAAVAAAWLLARGADRGAGVLLLVSVLTPTYFAYALNVPALLVGAVLVAAPRLVLPAPPTEREAVRR